MPVVRKASSEGQNKLTWEQGRSLCNQDGLLMATPEELQQAWEGGYNMCHCGWLADHSVKYPITEGHPDCGGSEPGIRNCTDQQYPTGGLYDVYCSTTRGGIKFVSTLKHVFIIYDVHVER